MSIDPTELEIRLDALINGALGDRERQDTLDLLARDPSARALLAEMLSCRRLAREAFGYDGADAMIDATLPKLAGRLARTPSPARTSWLGRMLGWPLLAAASLLAALAVGLWPHRPPATPSALPASPAVAGLTDQQVARLRQLWTAIAPGDAPTWVLVRNGGESFEQLPPSSADSPAGAVSLRCVFAASDGKIIDDFQILLPARTGSPLAVADAARIAGRPVACDVSASGGWVGLQVKVDDRAAGPVGLQGRVKTGQPPVEVGQFRLGDRDIRVFLQAVSVS